MVKCWIPVHGKELISALSADCRLDWDNYGGGDPPQKPHSPACSLTSFWPSLLASVAHILSFYLPQGSLPPLPAVLGV